MDMINHVSSIVDIVTNKELSHVRPLSDLDNLHWHLYQKSHIVKYV